jgi:hypothetical protein
MALRIVIDPLAADSRDRARAIRKLVRDHGGDRATDLLAFVNALVERSRPTLEQRFENLAREAQLPGWESDVEAFKRFNFIRNRLFHRGELNVRLQVSIGETEVRSLEDLVERYVNFALFSDNAVYQTRWRPPREATNGAPL